MNEILRAARQAKGYTQQQMAEFLGYKSKSAYNMIENGVNQPPIGVALRIAELVEKDAKLLFGAYMVQECRTKIDEQAATLETA